MLRAAAGARTSPFVRAPAGPAARSGARLAAGGCWLVRLCFYKKIPKFRQRQTVASLPRHHPARNNWVVGFWKGLPKGGDGIAIPGGV